MPFPPSIRVNRYFPPSVFRKSGETMPTFSTRRGTLTANRKKGFLLLVFMVTS